MLTNQQINKRTRHVRINRDLHRLLKIESVEKEVSITSLLNDLCEQHFNLNKKMADLAEKDKFQQYEGKQ